MRSKKTYIGFVRGIILISLILNHHVVKGENKDSIQLVVPHKVQCDTGFIGANGKYLFTFSKGLFSNDPIAIWDVESGAQIAAYMDHSWFVRRSFGDQYLACLSGQTVMVWNTSKGIDPIRITPPDYVNGIELDPSGNYLCARTYAPGYIYRTYVYRLSDGKFMYSAQGAMHVSSSSGNLVVFRDSTLEILDWSNGNVLRSHARNEFHDSIGRVGFADIHKPASFVSQLSASEKVLSFIRADQSIRIELRSKSGALINTFEGFSEKFMVGVINRDGSTLVSTHVNEAKIWDFSTGRYLRSLKPDSAKTHFPNYLSDISPNGHVVVLNGNRIYNARNAAFLYQLPLEVSKNNSEISGDNKWLVASGTDKNAYLFKPITGELLHTIRTKDRVGDCVFSPDSKFLAVCTGQQTLVWNLSEARIVATFPFGAKWDSGTFLAFNHDGSRLIIAADPAIKRGKRQIKVCNVFDGTIIKSSQLFCDGVLFTPDGKYVMFSDNPSGTDSYFSIYNAHDFSLHFVANINSKIAPTNAIVFSPDSRYLRAYAGSVAYVWDLDSGKIKHQLNNGNGQINLAVFSTDGKFVLTTGNNHNMCLWDTESGAEMLRLYSFDGGGYIHIHPSGLFDGSPGALEKVFFRRGTEVVELAQLKDRYYEPGLWEKVMKGEALRDVRGLDQLKLEPTIELQDIQKGEIPIKLTKREGGYGKISIFINGKEVVADARSRGFDTSKTSQMVMVKIENHPFLKPGQENQILVKTWSADGFVESRGAVSVYKDPRPKSSIYPNFYGIVCGISEYQNSQLNLTFSINDARAMSQVLQKGAANLFGEDRTFIYTLTSPGELKPTRENLQKVFDEIKAKSKPEDVLLIYLSGHGIVWGSDLADFYYLTSDAFSLQSTSYSDPAIRQKYTVSTSDFTNWINAIPALKQVMIIDACGSGKAVDNLIAARSVDPSQVRAIDRMKDRTGMFVISGCAADAVSYEATRYGQGLLTYALLQGMKGAALKDNKFIDIETLMQHAREEVPQMAYGIGGIQTPQILMPKGGSFDIGLLSEIDKKEIPLANAKPVFIRSLFIDAVSKRDKLSLTKLVNERLSSEAALGVESKFLFFDSDEYDGGYALSGDYTLKDGQYMLEVVLSKGDEMVTRFLAAAIDANGLVEAIYLKLQAIQL